MSGDGTTASDGPAADDEELRRRIVRVGGTVQGVGFRFSTARRAEELGLAGTVRNLLDGTVEVDVEGPDGAVGEMLAWLEKGPPSATVHSTRVREAEPRGAEDFRIR